MWNSKLYIYFRNSRFQIWPVFNEIEEYWHQNIRNIRHPFRHQNFDIKRISRINAQHTIFTLMRNHSSGKAQDIKNNDRWKKNLSDVTKSYGKIIFIFISHFHAYNEKWIWSVSCLYDFIPSEVWRNFWMKKIHT